jgi:hypothetical protein
VTTIGTGLMMISRKCLLHLTDAAKLPVGSSHLARKLTPAEIIGDMRIYPADNLRPTLACQMA